MGRVVNTPTAGCTFTGETRLETINCCECGILFALPERLLDASREQGNFKIQFYCPHGHRQGFGDGQVDKLKREAKRAKDDAARARASRDQAKASAAAVRGHNTRLKKRVAHGVCPCCQRTFKQLSQHMARQHPNYVESPDA